jgi:hypothetical protein
MGLEQEQSVFRRQSVIECGLGTLPVYVLDGLLNHGHL